MRVFAAVPATVNFTGTNCAFALGLVLQYRRDTEVDPPLVLASVSFDRELYDAIQARVRWTRGRMVFRGADVIPGRNGTIEFQEDMVPGNFRTVRFKPVGNLWSIPTVMGTPPVFDPCPPPPSSSTARTPPREWGNLPTSLYLALGSSPTGMREVKLHEGLTYQKSNHGQVQVLGEIGCVDDSLLYADKALCYQLNPFAGKRRGDITRDVAAAVGIPPDRVKCPVGRLVTKPILLSNASLIPFLDKLWEPEFGFPFFDENGDLVVQTIDVQNFPKWAIEAKLGDFDIDEIDETPPSRAPSRMYVSGSIPVKDGQPTTSTTETFEMGFYNPRCWKVRPGGLTSYLQAPDTNGVSQYAIYPAQKPLEISRTITETTSLNGLEVLKVTTKKGWYNPQAFDPNFDTYPAGTSYNSAYGDKSFHRDESETYIEISKEVVESLRDENGTLLKRVTTPHGWLAPKAALPFLRDFTYEPGRKRLRNVGGQYIYSDAAGGSARTIPQEIYQPITRVEQIYSYGPDGAQFQIDTNTFGWQSPQARSDYDPDTKGLPPEPNPNPGPAPIPPPGPTLHVTVTGPIRHVGPRFFFTMEIPQWVNDYIKAQFGGPYAATGLFPAGGSFAVLTYFSSGGGLSQPVPGANQTISYSGAAIDPVSGVLSAEVYVDVPRTEPYIPDSQGRNKFTGPVLLFSGLTLSLTGLGGTSLNLPAQSFPLTFNPYANGSPIP